MSQPLADSTETELGDVGIFRVGAGIGGGGDEVGEDTFSSSTMRALKPRAMSEWCRAFRSRARAVWLADADWPPFARSSGG